MWTDRRIAPLTGPNFAPQVGRGRHGTWEPQLGFTQALARCASQACALALMVAFMAATPGVTLAQNSQFKGWAGISRELSTRLAEPGRTLDLYQFVPADDLDDLLGTWYRFGDE